MQLAASAVQNLLPCGYLIHSISAFSKPNWKTKKDPIYVLKEMKLRGLVPNFHIHVSVRDLYIHTTGPLILLQQVRRTDRSNAYKSLKDT